MLASDEEDGTLKALKFSLASDIVELVVLTTDELFLQTMREAVGGARRLWHVATGDKVGDLLVAGEVGIVVLDVNALLDSPSVFVGQIKRQFPDLVVVVAGSREEESGLARLISAGIVYRFIHKPVSPGRGRLFVETAVKKYSEQQRRRTLPAPVSRVALLPRPALLAGGVAGALLLITAVAWLSQRHSGGDAAVNLNTSGNGIAAESPQPAVAAGLTELRERLLAHAENALLEEHLDEAAADIETARTAGVESGRIAFLSAQLVRSRERLKIAQSQMRVRAAGSSARASAAKLQPEDKVTPLLNLAAQRMDAGHLAEPEGNSARFYVQQALQLDPDDSAVLDTKQALAMQMLSAARGAIDKRDFAAAAGWLTNAAGIAAPANIDTAQSLLDISRRQAASDVRAELLKNANERLLQDRLVQPANDSAKYYLLTLRSLDPASPVLAPSMQDLSNRLVAKAQRAVMLKQYEAARSWLEEADSIGFVSGDSDAVRRELQSEAARTQ